MFTELRTITAAVAFAASLATTSALACDDGPWPIDFAHGMRTPKQDSANMLLMLAKTGGTSDGVRLLIYNKGASSPTLWRARVAAVRSILIEARISAERIQVIGVSTQNGMARGSWVGRATKMAVERTTGCG